MKRRTFGRRWLLPVVLALWLPALVERPLAGQDAAFTLDSASNLEQRERLFQQLAKDVDELERHGSVLKRSVTLVRPSVVHIEAQKGNASQYSSSVEEAGSGVLIELNERFYVLTNRHVINEAPWSRIRIKLADGRQLNPTRVWSDADTDVAVMAVEAGGLIPARLGDSNLLDIGDFVLAVGSPFGLSHSVTYGIISAKGRRDLQLGEEGVRYQDFLQTDAAINPGNSGGPLVNLRGEVIGINTAIASSSGGNEGIGFTIPINMAMLIARQLIEHGTVVRAYLGVVLDSDYSGNVGLNGTVTGWQGTKIRSIQPNSPAAASDLRAGDVIVQFDGIRIEDDAHLVNRVSLTPVNKEVDVVLLRDGQPVTIQVTVSAKSELDTQSAAGGSIRDSR